MAKKNRVRLLLVEDHEIVRVALRVLLERTGEIHVVDEAGKAAIALTQVRRHEPDVVLLDVKLPDRSGIDLCRDIRAAFPKTHVVFLTAFPDNETLSQCMQCGAAGYLQKTIGLTQLVEAIKTVTSGQSYFDLANMSPVATWLNIQPVYSEPSLVLQLTPQERRVIALIANGHTNREIGDTLGLSEKTVKNYVSNAFQKLRISRRSQAAVLFAKAFLHTAESLPQVITTTVR